MPQEDVKKNLQTHDCTGTAKTTAYKIGGG